MRFPAALGLALVMCPAIVQGAPMLNDAAFLPSERTGTEAFQPLKLAQSFTIENSGTLRGVKVVVEPLLQNTGDPSPRELTFEVRTLSALLDYAGGDVLASKTVSVALGSEELFLDFSAFAVPVEAGDELVLVQTSVDEDGGWFRSIVTGMSMARDPLLYESGKAYRETAIGSNVFEPIEDQIPSIVAADFHFGVVVNVIPLPGTLLLFATALAGIQTLRRCGPA